MNTAAASATLLALSFATAAAVAQTKSPSVSVGTVEQATVVEEVPLTGSLTSPRVARVSTSVEGLVEAIHVDEGDRVDAGDPLLSLDQELEQLSLEAARAATREAEAELADVRRRLEEAEQLAARQNIPATQLRSLESQLQISRSALARLTAEEARQAARLRRYRVVAPFTGVISRRLTEAGEWITPGTAVVELIATDGLRLDFRVPQHYYPRIDDQARLEVRLAAAPGRSFEARIGSVVPVNDPSARTFLLRAYLDTDDVALTPGMSARGTLRLDAGRRAPVVSRDALLRYPDGRVTVWVVENESDGLGAVSERHVKTGVAFDGKVEVETGLESGARVVVAGNEALQDGQRVRIER